MTTAKNEIFSVLQHTFLAQPVEKTLPTYVKFNCLQKS